MDFLPFFFDLKNKSCLLVGGGTIATRKARLLHKAQAQVHVVAPSIQDELQTIASASGGSLCYEHYAAHHLDEKILVISATDDRAINERVANDCHRLRLPVNVVDQPALCSIIMPAIVDRDPLIIGITSGGEAPVLARRIRTQLESTIPGRFGDLGRLASRFRDRVKKVFVNEDGRRRFWESVINGPIATQVLAGNMKEAERALADKLAVADNSSEGEVYLVGAGPGDPDLLTFKALRLMQQAEVVLYDRLVSDPIVEMVRRDAERIYVGKKRDEHSMSQADISQLLVDLAKQGKRVLRLKGGDPFIFGRGGEELALLAEHHIPFQVVPGVTAAAGCASYAGIPLTHRDYAQSVRFITGHLKDGELNYPWEKFVAPHQTLVFYMGLISLPIICRQLIAHGLAPNMSAAVVERGTLPEQQVHLADLASLPDLIEQNQVRAPALLIVGEVVQLHEKLNWRCS